VHVAACHDAHLETSFTLDLGVFRGVVLESKYEALVAK
jgi:hypothetical protein